MDGKTLRMAGMIAGIVVVLGILAISAQYFAGLTGGASAGVTQTQLEQLPLNLTISKEAYITLLSQMDAYQSVHDLATKNKIMAEVRSLLEEIAK